MTVTTKLPTKLAEEFEWAIKTKDWGYCSRAFTLIMRDHPTLMPDALEYIFKRGQTNILEKYSKEFSGQLKNII